MQYSVVMRFLFLLFCILLTVCHQVSAQPVVTASIKPLQLIARAITDGVSEPLLVLDGTQDPHHPSLRPSQRRAMDEADIFIWVGPLLETGMERVVRDLDADVITAMALPELNTYDVSGMADPHIWLDTRNVITMATALAQTLVDLDPENAGRYAMNLDAFAGEMQQVAADIARLLDPENFPPFVVYHNGYQYFENQFGLAHLASFTSNEDLQPGIRQVMAIKSILEERNVNCVLVNPSVNTRNLDNQLERDDLHFVVIDVLANDAEPVKDAFSKWLKALAQAFTACRR